MHQGGIPFRTASYVNFTKALPSRKPQTTAEEGADAMMTANHSRRPVKAPQSDGTYCPTCGKHHRAGTVCPWNKSFQFRRVLVELTKGGTARVNSGDAEGRGGQFTSPGSRGSTPAKVPHKGPTKKKDDEKLELQTPTEQLQDMTAKLSGESKGEWKEHLAEAQPEKDAWKQPLSEARGESSAPAAAEPTVRPGSTSESAAAMGVETPATPDTGAQRQSFGVPEETAPVDLPRDPGRMTVTDAQGEAVDTAPKPPAEPAEPAAPAEGGQQRTASDPKGRQTNVLPGLSQMFGTGQAVGSGLFTPGGTAGPTGSAVIQQAHSLLQPGSADARARYIQPQRQPAIRSAQKSLIDWKERYERQNGAA